MRSRRLRRAQPGSAADALSGRKMTEHRAHVSMAGFAIFLVINASQAWGGVFPFLPRAFQTDAVTLTFYLTQSLSFFATFAASTMFVFRFPGAARRMMVGIVTALVFAGSAAIIAAMYVPAHTMAFVVAGGLFLGVGCAGMFMLWQRYFASIPPNECNLRLVVGTALASLLYFSLYAIPSALTAFLVPVVLLPLCSLSLSLCVREMRLDQPMFEDAPRDHLQVYRHVVQGIWRAAIGVAAIAFTSGLSRGVALLDADVNAFVNVSSMLGSLVAAVALLLAWRAYTVRFGLDTVFRIAIPVLMTGMVFFPFMRTGLSLSLFAGLAYMAFSLTVVVMMMQSAQISRDWGVNPVFSYGLLGTVAYGTQSLGFLLGWLLYDGILPGVGSVEFLSLLAIYAMGMALYVTGGMQKADADPEGGAKVELIARPRNRARLEEEGDSAGSPSAEESRAPEQGRAAAPKRNAKGKAKDDGHNFTDRLSKQCFYLQGEYGLTNRETEVAEAIARGLSMANIAEKLFISENTVRTHAKHIYAKLGIHSRQELSALLQDLGPGPEEKAPGQGGR